MHTRTISLCGALWMLLATGAEAAQKTVPVTGVVSVSVILRSSALTVIPWDRAEVEVRSEGDRLPPIEQSGEVVRIGLLPERGSGGSVPEDDLELRLPAAARLELKTISGDVRVEGLSGRAKITTVSGDVTVNGCTGGCAIKTVSGDVRLKGLDGGVVVEGVSGDVTGSGLRGPSLEIKSVSGDLSLEGVAAREVQLSTHSGEVRAAAAFPTDAVVRVSSFSGDISLALPRDAGFTLSAKSRSGSVGSDIPLQVSEQEEDNLQGRAGSGGADITLSTFSGDARLRVAP
jgi:DUF4097 and DUF4098 domain-containing protein YvlB